MLLICLGGCKCIYMWPIRFSEYLFLINSGWYGFPSDDSSCWGIVFKNIKGAIFLLFLACTYLNNA